MHESWEWAVKKLRHELHCTAKVEEAPDFSSYHLTIELPDGEIALDATIKEAHMVQFIIDAFREAQWEVNQ